MLKLFRTETGAIVTRDDAIAVINNLSWDELINHAALVEFLEDRTFSGDPQDRGFNPLAPIASQEIWAAGVNYFSSRDARMEESQDAGGGSFYDRVYSAARPELFFKATAHRVAAPGAPV